MHAAVGRDGLRRLIHLVSGLAVAAAMMGCNAHIGERDHRTSIAASTTGPSLQEASAHGTTKLALSLEARAAEIAKADPHRGRCALNMVEIEGRFCIDKYEASLVDILPSGEERVRSPFGMVGDARVRAVSEPNVYPQGYVSAHEAARACAASSKRLCRVQEWKRACAGPEKRAYGYGDKREPGRCNDKGRSPVILRYGFRFTPQTMNDGTLNQLEHTLSKSGEHSGCTNGYGVYDMVGNLHEWVADPGGTFYGGYYQDVSSFGHGEGCSYRTTAHDARYHDYSTGFRCCADVPR